MKIAIFVEGLTELEFVRSFLISLYGSKGFHLQVKKQHGGKLILVVDDPAPGTTDFVLLVNCQTDNQVKSQIRDQYPTLASAGYNCIIGLRDIYPDQHNTLPRYKAALFAGLPTGNVPIFMHLSVLEIEAWFLDELTHFQRIDPALTPTSISAAGYDLVNIKGEQWPHPADTLDNIYRLAGKRYRKKTRHIQRTINALSPEEMYVNVALRSPHFSDFLTSLESAIFPPVAAITI